jgi:hypothetical protein
MRTIDRGRVADEVKFFLFLEDYMFLSKWFPSMKSGRMLNKLLSLMSKVSKYSHINIQRNCDFNK